MDVVLLSPVVESDPAPLLPRMLARPAAYVWLWLLPIGVMLALNGQGYWLISGNMDPGQHRLAWIFGLAGLINFVAGIVLYVITRWCVRKTSSTGAAWWLGLPAIIVQVAYLWLVVSQVDDVLPRSVVVWIYPPARFLFNQFAFAMMPLFLGILQVACAAPARGTAKPIVVSAGMAIGAPVALYLGIIVLPRLPNLGGVGFVLLATLAVILGVIMFIGIVRALMLALRFAQRWQMIAERVAIVVVALLLPLGGLWLNRSIAFPVDFQAWEVYALTVINAGVLLFASWHHATWPRLSFNLLWASLPFSLYFFIVFLPYTPLSILAVIAMGAGFLVLTPTLLFTLHVHLLNRTRRASTLEGGSRTRAMVSGLLCFLALPMFFYFSRSRRPSGTQNCS